MNLIFATEARFIKRDNKYYSLGGFSKTLWDRYLEHFDTLTVVARVSNDSSEYVDDTMIASCDRVNFIELPYYIGLIGYLKNRRVIRNILLSTINKQSVYICRLPGQIGSELINVLKENNIPYACEVVGNPWDVFSKGSINHPLRPIIRRIATKKLKKQVRGAMACLYVTKYTLQDMYPADSSAFSIGVSDVIIKKCHIAESPKKLMESKKYTIMSVGSLSQMYKAPDIVIKALAMLKEKGIETKLVWLGDGIFKSEMIELAKKYEVDADFKGNVSASDVHLNLNNADIFLLVSRTEGLPRAIVEAMAHGLPCIGSNVGGIPELLSKQMIVEKENVSQLANLIEKLIKNPELANKESYRNLQEAKTYEETRLIELRNQFFKYIKQKNSLD